MKSITILASLIALSVTAICQTPESLLQKVQQDYTTEKMYLHMDKSLYQAGETIWFKAYLMQGYLPSSQSTIMVLELLNDTGKLIDKKILPVNGSTAVGEFSLPNQLPQGNYTIKAFTRNLMNFGFDAFYYHSFYVYNNAPDAGNTIKSSEILLHFFPEGGNLIGNVMNSIAFKSTDKYGVPKDIEGRIVDRKGQEQFTFKSTHDGMGTFTFMPQAGEEYTAEYHAGDGNKGTLALPAALAEGVVLNIKRTEKKAYFIVDGSTATNENLLPDYILGVQENQVTFKVPVPAGAKRITGEIPMAQLPSGILQVTVFNKNHKALAERLLFVNSGDYIAAGKFNADLVDLKPRAKNAFSFMLEDTTAGSFSVAVTQAPDENKNEDHLVSRLLLTSDIKGIVYNPAYYFESNDEQHQQDLELVMLTNGWRRYTWNELLSNRFPTMAFKDPGFITVEGYASNPNTGKPLGKSMLSVVARTSDKKTDFMGIITDSIGRFKMEGMVFEDTTSFTFKNNAGKNTGVRVTLASPSLSKSLYSLKTPLPKFIDMTPDAKQMLQLKSGYAANQPGKFNGIVLDEIKLKVKLKSKREVYEKQHVTGSLGGMASRTLDLISEPTNSSLNVFQYLQSRLNGVNITGGPLNYSIVYRNSMTLGGGKVPMNIYLDEFLVDQSQVSTMKISEIAMVKVFAGGGLSGGTGGALALYTKRGEGIFTGNDVPNEQILVEGFSPTKEFFSPDYSSAETNVLKDERTTLYWNPYLLTDPKHNVIQFSFHNGDNTKKFRVVLEGILENGKLLHLERIIE